MAIAKNPERRQFGRRKVFKAAVIIIDGGQRISGNIVDMTVGGARMRVLESIPLTADALLEIPGDDIVVKCRIVHVDETSVGLQYIKPPQRISWLRNR